MDDIRQMGTQYAYRGQFASRYVLLSYEEPQSHTTAHV